MPHAEWSIDKWVKECAKCHHEFKARADNWPEAYDLLLEHFSPGQTDDGLHGYCKECIANAKHGRKSNGARRDDLLKAQEGKCGVCNKEIAFDGIYGAVVDHDHKTGIIRGVLCQSCNKDLGPLENKEWLEKALNYLATHENPTH